MQIYLKAVTQDDAMWVEIPQNLISAEKNNFTLYVDGQEKKYELATSAHSTIMGFMVPTNTALVEIQGTSVVPEFPFAFIVLIIATVSVVLIQKIRPSQV
jgi:hypothetical protein